MKPTESIPSFESLGLTPEICKIVRELGYEAPTPVQAKSIPVIIAGHDMIGQAQTGTGKTAAFALPLLTTLQPGRSATQILVLTPTRELAIQVAEAFKSYARQLKGFNVLPIYGGQSIGTQLRQLERRPQVIVGTPGRVMDHLRRGSLQLKSLTALVLDEADEMLSMGFLEDIQWIIEQAPKEKQTILFSATMAKGIRAIAQKYLNNPQEVVVQQTAATTQLISQSFWNVNGLHKLDALTRILEVSEVDGVLIFMRTKTATLELAEKLEARGYSAGALNGDMNQAARDRTVQSFKQGRLDVLVATDVAARGLDIDRVSHVINYDVPFDLETYTHRIGRTGRAGRAGTAILFISSREMGLLRVMERGTGKKIPPFQMPTREDLAKKRLDRFVTKIEEALKRPELSLQESLLASVAERLAVPVETVAVALCALLHDESPVLGDTLIEKMEVSSRDDHQGAPRHARGGDRRSGGGRPRHGSKPRHFEKRDDSRRRDAAPGKRKKSKPRPEARQ